jgi:hypothetical protein
MTTELKNQINVFKEQIEKVKEQVHKKIVGQEELIDSILI